MPKRAPRPTAPKAARAAQAPPIAPVRPPRPTKAQVQAERYPNVDRFPALKRALFILRQMESGKTREEAQALADQKVGARAPHFVAKGKRERRGVRPEPEKRIRVQARPRAAAKARR